MSDNTTEPIINNIYEENIAVIATRWNNIFSGNKNIVRMLTYSADGLKPVHRRIMYMLEEYLSNNSKVTEAKVATLIGRTMEIHPHGDSAIYNATVLLAAPHLNNVPVLEALGNFGSSRGDVAAAARYIYTKFTPYGWDCFFSEWNSLDVRMKPSYDGSTKEPVTLPSKYPHALINGQSGIGTGIASSIPPYNLKEVLQATIKLIKNRDATVVLIPDSPTGCKVLDEGKFAEISKTGRGTYKMRANIEYNVTDNIITVMDVPYLHLLSDVMIHLTDKKNRETLYSDMIDLKDKSTLISDDSNEYQLKLEIQLKPSANGEEFIKKLYKHAGLEDTYSVNLNMVKDYKCHLFNIKEYLLDWIDNRRDAKINMYNGLFSKYIEEKHLNETLLMILKDDNLEKAVAIIRGSKDTKESSERLFKEFKSQGITSIQAKHIATLRMSTFQKDERKKCKERIKELEEKIAETEKILDNDELIDEIIIKELEEGIKKHGRERRSAILDVSKKKHVEDKVYVVAISSCGYAKKILPDSPTGKVGKGGNIITCELNNRDKLLVIDSKGFVSRIAVSSIPEQDTEDSGIELSRFFTVTSDIVSIIREGDYNSHLLLISKKGIMKCCDTDNFKKIKDKKSAINIADDDELVSCEIVARSTKDVLVYTNIGNGIRINGDSIPIQTPAAKGKSLVHLEEGEEIINTVVMKTTEKMLLYITSKGKCKLTEKKYLPPISDKKDTTFKLITLEEGEELASLVQVNQEDTVIVYKKYGEPEELDCSEIKASSRMSKADKKMIKMKNGEKILGVKVIK